MQNKDLIIIALIVVLVYLIYQQNNQSENQSPNIIESPKVQQLRTELNHAQTLYQQRVEKDTGDSEKVKQLTEQLAIAEEIINKPRTNAETQTDLSTDDIININKSVEYYQKLSEQKDKTLTLTQQELKNSQNNSEELKNLLENKQKESQEQLRKINLLFNDQVNNYQTIDFAGLYSLLSQIVERERERDKIIHPLSRKDQRKMKKKK